MKCGLRMTLVLPGSNGCHGWGTRLSFPTGLLLSRYCLGFAMESVPFPCPCVPPREKSPHLAPQSLEHPLRCSSTPAARTLPPAPPAAGAGWKEQQTPKMWHCAKCFQTLQDVTVSQFQFIRRRREDAVTSKLSFSL